MDELKTTGKDNVLIVGHGSALNYVNYYSKYKTWEPEKYESARMHLKNTEIVKLHL